MRKNLLIILVMILSLTLLSCGKKVDNELTPNQKIVQLFETTINKRWTAQNKLNAKTEEESIEKTVKILEDEIKPLSENLSAVDDPILKQNITDYIEGVELQIEALKTNDYNLQNEYTEKSDSLRKPALVSLVDTYGIKINTEHEQTYKDFKATASVINKENEAKKYAESLAASLKFEETTDTYGDIELKTILENTSDFNYDALSFDVKFQNADGIVVDTDHIYLSNFNKGEKQQVSLNLYSPEPYETILVTLSDFYIE